MTSYPAGRTLAELEHNLAALRKRIATACRRAARAPSEVRLLPESKTVDEARLRLACQAGCRGLGENPVWDGVNVGPQRAANAAGRVTRVDEHVVLAWKGSRLREIALGGATFELMRNMPVPTLIAS